MSVLRRRLSLTARAIPGFQGRGKVTGECDGLWVSIAAPCAAAGVRQLARGGATDAGAVSCTVPRLYPAGLRCDDDGRHARPRRGGRERAWGSPASDRHGHCLLLGRRRLAPLRAAGGNRERG